MHLIYPNRDGPEGSLVGPWNSPLGIAVGYARRPGDEPHYHAHMREIFVVTSDSGEFMAGGHTRRIEAGAVGIVEPGEVHGWRSASSDFQILVIHEPYVAGDTIIVAEV